MATTRTVPPAKVASARDAVIACMGAVESALATLRSTCLGIRTEGEVASPEFVGGVSNTTMMIALSLHRLEDSTRRYLKRLAADVPTFNRSVAASLPIQVSNRLANSWKHGLGGQQGNATLLNGIIRVERADGYPDQESRRRVNVIGMMIADAKHGAFPSHSVFAGAIDDWTAILGPLDVASLEWRDRLNPPSTRPPIDIKAGTTCTVPPGSLLHVEVPGTVATTLQSDAKTRRDAA